MASWLSVVQRKFAMCSELFEIQKTLRPKLISDIEKKNAAQIEFVFRSLEDIHGHVKRRNEKDRTSFMITFDIISVLSNNDNCILFEPIIHMKLCRILDDWINGCSFDEKNFERLKLFLKYQFSTPLDNLKTLYKGWKISPYYSEKKMDPCPF